MIAIIIGRATQFLLALAMMRVATTLLSPEEMGRVSLVLTTIAFFAMFLVNPVGMFINRRLHAWQATGVARYYLTRYAAYLLLVALIAAIGLPILYISGVVSFGVSLGWLIFLVCGSLLFNTINQTAIPSLNLLGDSGSFVTLSVATIAASFVCATFLVQMVQPSAQYWLLGLLLGQTLLAAVGYKVFFARLQKYEVLHATLVIRKRHLQTLFSFAWPVAIAAGLGWVQGQGYRYLMEGQLGLAQLGIFVAGYGISAGVIAGFESVLTTYFQPRLYRDVNSDPAMQTQAWQRYAAAVIPSLVLTVALIAVLASELTRIFLGEKFQLASDYVIWGALAEVARALIGIYSLNAHVHMRTRGLILPGVIGATLSILLCLVLIPRFGAVGVGAALALAGFVVVVVMHSMMQGQVRGGFPVRAIWVAGVYAVVLWVVAIGCKSLLDAGWSQTIGVAFVTGVLFLGFQYVLLREHLTDRMR